MDGDLQGTVDEGGLNRFDPVHWWLSWSFRGKIEAGGVLTGDNIDQANRFDAVAGALRGEMQNSAVFKNTGDNTGQALSILAIMAVCQRRVEAPILILVLTRLLQQRKNTFNDESIIRHGISQCGGNSRRAEPCLGTALSAALNLRRDI